MRRSLPSRSWSTRSVPSWPSTIFPATYFTQESVEEKVPDDYGPQRWLVFDDEEWGRLLASPDPAIVRGLPAPHSGAGGAAGLPASRAPLGNRGKRQDDPVRLLPPSRRAAWRTPVVPHVQPPAEAHGGADLRGARGEARGDGRGRAAAVRAVQGDRPGERRRPCGGLPPEKEVGLREFSGHPRATIGTGAASIPSSRGRKSVPSSRAPRSRWIPGAAPSWWNGWRAAAAPPRSGRSSWTTWRGCAISASAERRRLPWSGVRCSGAGTSSWRASCCPWIGRPRSWSARASIVADLVAKHPCRFLPSPARRWMTTSPWAASARPTFRHDRAAAACRGRVLPGAAGALGPMGRDRPCPGGAARERRAAASAAAPDRRGTWWSATRSRTSPTSRSPSCSASRRIPARSCSPATRGRSSIPPASAGRR